MTSQPTAGVLIPPRAVGHRFHLCGWAFGVEDVSAISAVIGARKARVTPSDGEPFPGAVDFIISPEHPLPNGTHSVMIADQHGDVLTTTEILVSRDSDDEPLVLFELDAPGPRAEIRGDVIFVDGWALLDSQAPAYVEVSVDNRPPIRARTRIPRPDVADALPDFVEAGISGFEARVPVDVPAGSERAVAITVTFRAHGVGEWTAPTRTIVLRNPKIDDSDAILIGRLRSATTDNLARIAPRAIDSRRLLVFTHSLGLGGAQLWLAVLLSGLVKRHRLRPVVISQLDGPLRQHCADLDIPVHITSPYRVTDVAAYEGHVAELAHLAKGSGAGVALVNTLGAFPAADAAMRAGIPTAWAIHESFELSDFAYQNWGPDPLPAAIRARWVETLADVDQLVFVADATRESFLAYSSADRCRTVRYGSPMVMHGGRTDESERRRQRRRLGVDHDATLILSLGIMEPRKGQGQLISAAKRVRALHHDVHVAVVGFHPSPYARALADYISRAGMADWVHLVPTVSDPISWLQAADIFVNSSDVESLPRSIIEAVCCGLPVLATDVFGARELIVDGETGWLCEPGDVDALTAGLLRALDTPPAAREKMASAAFEHLRGWLPPGTYADDYQAMLVDLMRKRDG